MKIVSLYGPFELNGYNLSYIIGISLFVYLANKHPQRAQYLSSSAFINLCIEAALAGLVGGRVLHVLSSLGSYPSILSYFSIWDGGLSVLGGLIGVLGYTVWYCHKHTIPLFALTDIAALYAPLLQAIGRIGCFTVGCCYGAPTSGPLSITYSNPDVFAPLGVALHPAQLYSALLFVMLFGLLHLLKKHATIPGTLTLWYFIGMSLERFIIDFIRGDRIPYGVLSFYQWIAIGIGIPAVISLGILQQQRTSHESV